MTFVEETNLATRAAEIRRALGDSAANARFVRTVYGFGYRFVADVTVGSNVSGYAQPRLWLILERRHIPLLEGENVIGRAPDVAIPIDSPGISRRHARILVTGGEALLEDLDSKNGTHVNGRPITAPCPVIDGDEIRLGAVAMIIRAGSPLSPTETLAIDGA